MYVKILNITNHQRNIISTYYLTKLKWLLSKRQAIINAGKDVEKGGLLYNAGENVN